MALACLVAGRPAIAQSAAPTTFPSTSDSIAAAVAEASRRFGVPAPWILAVMRVESGGDPRAVSRAGAMGLMQVMPATYAELRRDLGLGSDPLAIRDNVLAGVAYLRRMFDRYGTPGFLAAYNAGPGRWEAHLAGVRPLPVETIRYVERLAAISGGTSIVTTVRASPDLPPSPFTAPLFAPRRAARGAAEGPTDRNRIAAILVANTTFVPPSESLFVGGSTTTVEPRGDGIATPGRVSGAVANDGLFVPRTPKVAPR